MRARLGRQNVIYDRHERRGDFAAGPVGYRTSLQKEAVSRSAILERNGSGMRLLDVGGGDGSLTYLLGITPGLRYDPNLYADNKRRFDDKYEYFSIDIAATGHPKAIVGDICDETLLDRHRELRGFFDVTYSNNAFEHFERPWIAAANMVSMLRAGGLCVVVAPFSLRYHEVPRDYFRFTHTGLALLFQRGGDMRLVESGYDIHDRRVNWQGGGERNDICPVDEFGAWRENWFAVAILEKRR